MTTIAEFAAGWPGTRFARPAAATNRNLSYMVRRFVDEHGERHFDELGKAEALDFIQAHPASARFVRMMYADARSIDVCLTDPFEGLKMPSSDGRGNLVLPTMEAIEECERWTIPLLGGIRFAAYVGLRLGEFLAVEDDWIDGDVLDIRYQLDKRGRERPCKAGSERRVVIPAPALEGLPEGRSGRLWPLGRTAQHDAWDSARRHAGLSDFPWHGLRHVAATWWFERGATMEEVGWQLGHSKAAAKRRSMTALYVHAQEKTMLERLRAVAS